MASSAAVGKGLEAALRHDRIVVVSGLGVVLAASWLLTLAGAGMPMAPAPHSAMTQAAWSAGYALMILLMWWVMMVAMMVPGAAPVILLFAALQRRSRPAGRPHRATLALTLGYLAVWGLFSLGITLLQWGLHGTGLVAGDGRAAAPLAALILALAGVYQLTPVKRACLRHCRRPVDFLTAHWGPRLADAWRMGVVHGAFCAGCCWFLMLLLFVGGMMNLLWIGGLTLYVLLEKLAPHGERIARAGGLLLIVAAAAVLWQAA